MNGEHQKWLVYGKIRGYILPFAIDTQEEFDKNARENFRATTIDTLKRELLAASMSDSIWERAINWYKRLPLGRIPGTSILELVAIADDNMLIKKFALHLWLDALNRNESLDTLKASLIEFSEQMSFLWAWVSKESVVDYAKDLIEYKGEVVALKELRGQAGWFLKGCRNGAKLRGEISYIKTNQDLQDILNRGKN